MRYRRFVALGDSITEGVGDPAPSRPNGLRGWADRCAEQLARQHGDLRYANLAVRGRKLEQIAEEQVAEALALEPDLVSFMGGGNDLFGPRVDFDRLAATYEVSVARLVRSGAQVLLFTVPDIGHHPVFKPMRGRVAILNEVVREVADKNGAVLVDLWRLRGWTSYDVLTDDRLHLNAVGHQWVTIAALEALGVQHGLRRETPALPHRAWRERRVADLAWTKDHLAPWFYRRVTRRSSGDGVVPRFPALTPLRARTERRHLQAV